MEDGFDNGIIRFKHLFGKSVAGRENLGRIYAFGVIGGMVMVVLTAVFSAFKLYILNSDIQAGAFLLFALFLLNGSAAARLTTVQKKKELYHPLCLAYLALFSISMYAAAFACNSNLTALVILTVMMSVIGILPILNKWVFLTIWGLELIPAIVLIFVRGFSGEGKMSVITMFAMSIVLSHVVYNDYQGKKDYQQSLENALSEAETDALTQLLNRRGLERRVENIWPHCIRQHSQVAVLMLDIDNFKKYNDTFGHAAGDECLAEVTAAVRRAVKRRTDYAARVGGEEFLVFLTGIDAKQAVKWCLELKESIEALKIPQAETNFCPYVTVSMGLATAMVQNDTRFDVMKDEADKSLYDAKYNGRACLYYKHRSFGKRPTFKHFEVNDSSETESEPKKAGNE